MEELSAPPEEIVRERLQENEDLSDIDILGDNSSADIFSSDAKEETGEDPSQEISAVEIPESEEISSMPEEELSSGIETEEIPEVKEHPDLEGYIGNGIYLRFSQHSATLAFEYVPELGTSGVMSDEHGWVQEKIWKEYAKDIVCITFESGITTICEDAFLGLTNLKAVTLPDTLESIGNEAFRDCTSLENLYFPESLTEIGDRAFENCTSLNYLDLPKQLKSIGEKAFYNCSNVKEVSIHALKLTKLGAYALGYEKKGSGSGLIPNFTIQGNYSLILLDYAKSNGIKFEEWDEDWEYGSGKCGDNMFWQVSSYDNILRITGRGEMYHFTESDIPWRSFEIDRIYVSYGIYSIGNNAFRGLDTQEISLPESLEKIGDFALKDNLYLRRIRIPDYVYVLGTDIFSGCTALKEVVLPSRCMEIQSGWFKNCISLEKIPLSPETSKIGKEAFYGCLGLRDTTFSEDIQTLDINAFMNCPSMKTVKILNENMNINARALGYLSNDKKVSGFKIQGYAGSTAETYAKQNGFTFEALTRPVSGVCGEKATWIFDQKNGTLRILGSGSMYDYQDSYNRAPWHHFENEIRTLVISAGITHISDYAFMNLQKITNVNLPEGLTSIGVGAFESCTSMTAINIPKQLKVIDARTFEGCSSLIGIVLPEGVTTVGSWSFRGCCSLKKIVFPEKLQYLGSWAFEDCTSLTEVEFLGGPSTTYEGVFENCTSLAKVTLSSRINTLGAAMFAGCSSLKEIVIPRNVYTIHASAFLNCQNLKKVTILNNLNPEFGEQCFGYLYDGDSAYTKVDNFTIYGYTGSGAETYAKSNGFKFVPLVPATSGTCGTSAYWEYNKTTKTLTISGSGAMENFVEEDFVTEAEWRNTAPWCGWASEILHVVVAEGITSIGNGAFMQLEHVKDVSIPNSVERIGAGAFYCNYELARVDVSRNVKEIGRVAFWCCHGLKKVMLSEKLNVLGQEAFLGCDSLPSIVLPENLKVVPDNLFGGDLELREITFLNPTAQISENSFPYLPEGKMTVRGYRNSTAESIAGEKGYTFIPLNEGTPKGKIMFRLYNPYSGEHLYTASEKEKNDLVSIKWNSEGIGWYAPLEDEGTLIWRLYNPKKGFEEHHYTSDEYEIYVLTTQMGWKLEGPAWRSAPDYGIPVYRLFNDKAANSASSHHYTTDQHERDILVSQGWRYEGIAWYGVR